MESFKRLEVCSLGKFQSPRTTVLRDGGADAPVITVQVGSGARSSVLEVHLAQAQPVLTAERCFGEFLAPVIATESLLCSCQLCCLSLTELRQPICCQSSVADSVMPASPRQSMEGMFVNCKD